MAESWTPELQQLAEEALKARQPHQCPRREFERAGRTLAQLAPVMLVEIERQAAEIEALRHLAENYAASVLSAMQVPGTQALTGELVTAMVGWSLGDGHVDLPQVREAVAKAVEALCR